VQLFSFPSLGEYERYRTAVKQDEVALADLAPSAGKSIVPGV